MAKFKVGDRVVPNSNCGSSADFQDKEFYVVLIVDDDLTINLKDDDGDSRWRDESEFDLYDESPKEAANGIAPLSLIQYHLPLIIQWGRDRGILDNSTPLGQSRKTVEEVFELVEAAAQYKVTDAQCDLDKLADAIGDVFVTLVMVAGCAKLDINACVAGAYNEIKDRKGYLRPDGVFVKEEQA